MQFYSYLCISMPNLTVLACSASLDDIEVIPSSSFTTTDQEISSTQSVDVKLTPSGVTTPPTANAAEISQEENYTGMQVYEASTKLIQCFVIKSTNGSLHAHAFMPKSLLCKIFKFA